MNKSIIILVITILILSGCLPEESPLSDIEITDPSLIAPSIKLSKSIGENDRVTNKIEVWLFDKNKNSIELKGGEIRVNNNVMKIEEFNITHAPYYSVENTVELKTDYQFEIELSDGAIYTASIQTPDKDLKTLNLPSDYNCNNDMNITWKDIYLYDEMNIGLNCYFSGDSSGGQRLSNLDIEKNYYIKGSYTISKDNFNMEDGDIYKAIITLTGIKKGIIDERLILIEKLNQSFQFQKIYL